MNDNIQAEVQCLKLPTCTGTGSGVGATHMHKGIPHLQSGTLKTGSPGAWAFEATSWPTSNLENLLVTPLVLS